MEKDSFELQEVADVINKYFVAIKVDREERPDIDQIYMDAVVGLTGQGGWPMSVFLTPQLKPFWGGTFFYKAQFISILEQLHAAWMNEREKVNGSAEHITKALQERVLVPGEGSATVGDEIFADVLHQMVESFDLNHGGFGGAPKFPPSQQLRTLLRIYRRSNDPRALGIVTATLEAMARGGINDQLAGGFSRYATDAEWLVPHFEKMLYDNAQLVIAYLEGFQTTKSPLFESVARETLEYVLRDMTHPDGGFYSAEDAGEVGKEGEFYLWSDAELQKLLSKEELGAIRLVFGVKPEGNFEGHSILHVPKEVLWEARESSLVKGARAKLLAARSGRPRPHLDDKILTAWNGLMIAALAKGYQVLGDERYLKAAERAATFIRKKLFVNGELLRRYRDGEARFSGYLEDYAYLIEGLTSLYEAGFDTQWLLWAKELQDLQDKKFYDTDAGGYFYSVAPEAVVKKKDLLDNATPSANAVTLRNLQRLEAYFPNERYHTQYEKTVRLMADAVVRYPTAFSTTLQAVNAKNDGMKEVVLVKGQNVEVYDEALKSLRTEFNPNIVVGSAGAAGAEQIPLLSNREARGGKTSIYVCEQGSCKLPVTTVAEMSALISKSRPLATDPAR